MEYYPSKKTVRVRTRTAPLASSTTLKRKSKKRKRKKDENGKKGKLKNEETRTAWKKTMGDDKVSGCLVVWLYRVCVCAGFVYLPFDTE